MCSLQISNSITPFSNRNVVNFKANENNRQKITYAQEPDVLELQNAINKQKKQQRTQKIKQNVNFWLGGVALPVVMLGYFAYAIKRDKASEKTLESAFKIFDLGKSKEYASFESGTTDSSLVKQAKAFLSKNQLSEKAKKWVGYKDRPKLIYIYGHGGTGKTYFAGQYAQEAKALFIPLKYTDVSSTYINGTGLKTSSTFKAIEEACAKNPQKEVVVCLDEGDALFRCVSDGSLSAGEEGKTRGAVLTAIDTLTSKCKNLTFIVTSNYHPDNGVVDPIVLRRFTHKLETSLPDFTRADNLCRMYLKNIEGIPNDFYETAEYKNFVQTLVEKRYASSEIGQICENASESFANFAANNKIPDEELVNHSFSIEYLKEGMKKKGQAASLSNKLMDIDPLNNEELKKVTYEVFDQLKETWAEKPLTDTELRNLIIAKGEDLTESQYESIFKIIKANINNIQ